MPEPHAGFAAAIGLRQSTLQDLVRVFYHANLINHTIRVNFAPVDMNMFLGVPEMVFSVANSDQIEIRLTAWGNLGITLVPAPEESHNALLTMRVLATPSFTLSSGSLRFNVVSSSVTVDHVVVTGLDGAYTQPVRDYLASEMFRSLLQTGVRIFLLSQQLAPPLDVTFLGGVVSSPSATPTARILDNALLIGIDVNDGGVTTHGDASQLTDITAGRDIGMWLNPAALMLALSTVPGQVQQAATDAGATLDSFSMTLAEGHVHIAGSAHSSDGGVTFSADAIPHLVMPGTHEEWDEEYGEHFVIDTPPRDELWFEMANIDVDVSRPWWAVLIEVVGAVFAGLGPLIVESFVDMARNNIESGIRSSGTTGERNRDFTLPNTTEPVIHFRIETLECHANGMFTSITLRPQFQAATLVGATSFYAEEIPTAAIRFRVRLPFDSLEDDPALRIRWRVTRIGTRGAAILEQDGVAAGRTTLDLHPVRSELLTATAFRVSCRVYHLLGAAIEERAALQLDAVIYDRLDRSHPYVKWTHDVIVPVVDVEANHTHTLVGYNTTSRHSKIHRTAVPGRCRMVARFSNHVAEEPGSATPSLEYLDDLPFPPSELAARRRAVCDYCFFGGPTRTVPLI